MTEHVALMSVKMNAFRYLDTKILVSQCSGNIPQIIPLLLQNFRNVDGTHFAGYVSIEQCF